MDVLTLPLEGTQIIWAGTLASLIAGLAAGLGALPIFAFTSLSSRLQDVLLSLAAGIMLAATFFSLLIPALISAESRLETKPLATGVVILGLLAGAGLLWLIHHRVPHEHFQLGREGRAETKLRGIWLFIIAIMLHNFPEGMAVGVGFAGGDLSNGLSLAVGIGLQNLPEGMAVAAALVAIGYSHSQAVLVAFATGLVEPLGGLLGSTAVWLAEPLMPWILGFAAGAMLFIISDEIIPETHRRGHADQATFALLVGFAIMMYIAYTMA